MHSDELKSLLTIGYRLLALLNFLNFAQKFEKVVHFICITIELLFLKF